MTERFITPPSRGEAKHIRRQKAAARHDTNAADPLKAIEKSHGNQQKLTEIEAKLAGLDPESNPPLVAQLTIKLFWLKFSLNQVTRAENQSLLARFLNDLEERDPETLDWLEEEVSTEVGRDHRTRPVTRLIQIRREVMGPDQ